MQISEPVQSKSAISPDFFFFGDEVPDEAEFAKFFVIKSFPGFQYFLRPAKFTVQVFLILLDIISDWFFFFAM